MTSGRGGSRRGPFAVLTPSVLSMLTAALLLLAFPPPSMAAPGSTADGTEAVGQHGMGWLPSPPGEYRQCEIDTAGRQYKAAVDLSSQLPPVGDQGAQNSCVGWSTGYYYKSWQEGREHTAWDLTQQKYEYSPAFVFNQCTEGGGGIAFAGTRGAFPLLQNEGSTDLQEMPYNDGDYTTQPTATQLQAALPYRISSTWSYFWTPRSRPPLSGYTTSNSITALKAQLDAGEPFVIGFQVYSDFPDFNGNLPSAYYDKELSATEEGGHALCIVGCDDNANPGGADADHQGGFKAVNSWGAGWNGASAGYVYLSYDFVKRYVMEAWQMDDVVPDTAHINSITPNHGGSGSSLQIDGYNFGANRRNAKVTIDGIDATVNSWNDTRINASSPDSATTGSLIVYDWDNVPSNAMRFWASARWYLAEGSTNGGMETFVLAQNPNPDPVTVNLTLMTDEGEQKPAALQGVAIKGNSRITFNLNNYVTSYNVSTLVEATGNVVCERSMYGNARAWAHESIGATSTSPTWYLAEGCTQGGFETWVLVQNPNDTEVTVTLELQDVTTGGAVIADVPIAAKSRKSFNLGETLTTWSVSTMVTSTGGGVVCERAMYGNGKQWAHDSIGAEATSSTWYLAEGCTAGDFETWVLVQNPGTSPVSVDLQLQTDQGKLTPSGLQGVIISPKTRQSFNLKDYVTTYNVSTMVTSTGGGVVCERAMYGGNRIWAHESIGSTAPAATWYMAEGCTNGGMETWILVQNPNPAPVKVTLTLMTDSGPQSPSALKDVVIPAESRVSFNLNDYVISYNVSTEVVSQGGGVVCERAMYGNGRQWAHDSAGYAP